MPAWGKMDGPRRQRLRGLFVLGAAGRGEGLGGAAKSGVRVFRGLVLWYNNRKRMEGENGMRQGRRMGGAP